jgi:hypothetical protein
VSTSTPALTLPIQLPASLKGRCGCQIGVAGRKGPGYCRTNPLTPTVQGPRRDGNSDERRKNMEEEEEEEATVVGIIRA